MRPDKNKPKLKSCKKCGSEEFLIGYSEQAYQTINAAGHLGEDGHNVQGRELRTDDVWCRNCNARKKLTRSEEVFVLEEAE